MQDVKIKTNSNTQAKVNTQVEVSKGAMFVATAVPAAIGLWAVACFVGGLVVSGGPVAMVQSFFSAVTGM